MFEIQGENTVKSILLKDTQTDKISKLDVDGIFPYIGISPNTELFSGQLNQDKYGFIITDTTMATSVDGVYAIGDVRNTPLRQVVTAASDGAIGATYALRYIEQTKEIEAKL